MSNNIPGRGKQRKHGQDLNSNAMPMGCGQMAMPPNSAASAPFATPIISQPHALAAPDYGRPHYGGVEVQHLQQPPVSGSHNPMMVLPNGMNVQQEQPSQYANMQGLPQNMRGAGNNPNMQWQNPQQTQMAMHGGMAANQMNRGAPQQNRGGYTQQAQPMGYYAVPQAQGYPYMQPNVYQQQYDQQQQAAYAAAYAQQQQQYYQPMMGMMQQQQPGVAPMTMQAPPALQQQQQQQGVAAGGAPAAGAAMGGVPTSQQQSMHGGSPSSGVQPMHNGAVPVTTPSGVVPQSAFNPAMRAAQLQQQQQQQTVAAPIAPKKKNILLIVNRDTNKAINEDAIEESKKEEDAPKAEKEEAKGTDEPDSAAPEVKKQFAAQILEQTTKSDQPAPAPTAAPPVKDRKVLFSAEQFKQLGLEGKAPAHVPAPPAPRAPAPAAPVAAAPAAEQPGSEYLPSPLPTPRAQITRLKESEMKSRETWNETSMTTIKDDRRGTLVPQRTLMDFDEEPTQLYSKSSLSSVKEKEYIEMIPANDRRQLAPMDSKKRLLDIANRNAKTLPHLRSSHTVEQLSPNFSQEALRDGVVRPSSSKKLGVFSRLTMKK